MDNVIHMRLFASIFHSFQKNKDEASAQVFSQATPLFSMPHNYSREKNKPGKEKKSSLWKACHILKVLQWETCINRGARPPSTSVRFNYKWSRVSGPAAETLRRGSESFPRSCIWIRYNALSLGVSAFRNNALCSATCPPHLPAQQPAEEARAGCRAITLPPSGRRRHGSPKAAGRQDLSPACGGEKVNLRSELFQKCNGISRASNDQGCRHEIYSRIFTSQKALFLQVYATYTQSTASTTTILEEKVTIWSPQNIMAVSVW